MAPTATDLDSPLKPFDHKHYGGVAQPSVRQQLAGVVLNAHPNIQRVEYDRLKEILHNCLRHGPGSQNHQGHADFRAYLAGRIAYIMMLNPARGSRLREAFEQIRWREET